MHKIEYFFLKSLYTIFTFLPFIFVEQIANLFAFVLQHIIKYRHKVIVENLNKVYGENWPGDRKILVKNIYRHFTYLWFEVLQTKKITIKNFDQHFISYNFDLVAKSLSNGKGSIIMAGHLGNFEWISIYLGIKKVPFAAIAKRLKNRDVDTFMRNNRERNGCTVIYTKTALREGLRFLRSNKVLAIAADQDARKKGVFVDFLGLPSSTAVGPAIFQIRSGAPMLSIAAIRTSYAHFDVYFEEIELPENLKISDESLLKITQAHASVLEKWIRKYPEQWFWMHKRWKSKPGS
jgi:Kdo2-lipid IVA lauroyltransferase/acyltransferase